MPTEGAPPSALPSPEGSPPTAGLHNIVQSLPSFDVARARHCCHRNVGGCVREGPGVFSHLGICLCKDTFAAGCAVDARACCYPIGPVAAGGALASCACPGVVARRCDCMDTHVVQAAASLAERQPLILSPPQESSHVQIVCGKRTALAMLCQKGAACRLS